MHLSLCHRAWEPTHNEAVAVLMQQYGIKFLETASGKYPHGLANALVPDLEKAKGFWAGHGVTIVALQSLLYGAQLKPVLSSTEAAATAAHALKALILPSQLLGIKTWVFGSYQLRSRGDLSVVNAHEKMTAFLLLLAPELAAAGITLVVEAVFAHYGADYLNTHAEVWQLVQMVNHPNIKMHFDLGAAFLNHEDPDMLRPFLSYCHHIHLSAPGFHAISDLPTKTIREWAVLLKDCPAEYLSLEMFEHVTFTGLASLEASIVLVQKYFSLK